MDVDRLELVFDAANEGAHRTQTFRHIIESLSLPVGSTVADLGAGPCIFARIAADHGLQVTAVDARTERVPPAEQLGPIRFVQADVRDFDLLGFDVVLILGLLYHLEIPDQLELLERSRGARAVVIDTQVHISRLACTPEPHRFSHLHVTPEGYEGVEFTEAENPMASVGNKRSFWHTDGSLIRMFDATGFRAVTVVDPPYQSKHGARRFFVLRGRPS
jgi:ubiquinone/menaquinone biosynthesis C-methylase UbiE